MDFTFDNPFDDVFTDPNAPATVETAPVVVQPVQPAQPVYNPAVVAVQNPAPTAVVAPGPAVVQTTTNPGTTDYIAQTGSPVPQNPAVTPQQIYTASPVVQPPTLLQNNPTSTSKKPNCEPKQLIRKLRASIVVFVALATPLTSYDAPLCVRSRPIEYQWHTSQ